jgi:hypothetical protein
LAIAAGLEIIPSIVRVRRLTYEEAEDRLGDPDFADLERIAHACEARRGAAGATRIELPEAQKGLEARMTVDEDQLEPRRARPLRVEVEHPDQHEQVPAVVLGPDHDAPAACRRGEHQRVVLEIPFAVRPAELDQFAREAGRAQRPEDVAAAAQVDRREVLVGCSGAWHGFNGNMAR